MTAREAAHRYNIETVLDLPEVVDLPAEAVEAVAAHRARGREQRRPPRARRDRHGDARLWPTASRSTVRDDGAGFDPGRTSAGFGLTSMRERAEAIGGLFTVTSAPGAGTTIRVDVP